MCFRAFDHIFETIQVSVGVKYLVHASYLEIYNEEIRDLLGKDVKHKLDLKEHPEKGVYVQGWWNICLSHQNYNYTSIADALVWSALDIPWVKVHNFYYLMSLVHVLQAH